MTGITGSVVGSSIKVKRLEFAATLVTSFPFMTQRLSFALGTTPRVVMALFWDIGATPLYSWSTISWTVFVPLVKSGAAFTFTDSKKITFIAKSACWVFMC
jgi:hypothetical protein